MTYFVIVGKGMLTWQIAVRNDCGLTNPEIHVTFGICKAKRRMGVQQWYTWCISSQQVGSTGRGEPRSVAGSHKLREHSPTVRLVGGSVCSAVSVVNASDSASVRRGSVVLSGHAQHTSIGLFCHSSS